MKITQQQQELLTRADYNKFVVKLTDTLAKSRNNYILFAPKHTASSIYFQEKIMRMQRAIQRNYNYLSSDSVRQQRVLKDKLFILLELAGYTKYLETENKELQLALNAVAMKYGLLDIQICVSAHFKKDVSECVVYYESAFSTLVGKLFSGKNCSDLPYFDEIEFQFPDIEATVPAYATYKRMS